jgi:uncharacterized protein
MQFLVTAYDGTDEKAIERRLAARDEHIRFTEKMAAEGRHLYAAAIMSEEENMIGSVLIVDFPSNEDVYNWLKVEPYVTQQVWEKIDIQPCKVGPMFLNSNKQ